jgi:Tfp pilus assembly protein PilF
MSTAPQPLTPAQAQQLQRAHQWMQQGRLADAKQLVETVLAGGPRLVDALHLKALILKQAGQAVEAEACFKRALRLAPGHPQIQMNYATLLSDAGQHAFAIKALQGALKAQPRFAEAWLNLGLVALDISDNSLALKALYNAIDLAPENGSAWCGLGIAQRRAGERDAACTSFRQALARDPADTKSRYNLAMALRESDDPDAALTEMDTAIELGLTSVEALSARGHILADQSQFSAAVESYQSALARDPLHTDTHDALAKLLPQIDTGGDMLASYKKALAEKTAGPEFWTAALRTARELKQFQLVRDWSAEATRIFGQSRTFDIAHASALAMLGDLGQAKQILENLTSQYPDDTTPHNIFTHVLLALGEPDRAEKHALKATTLTPVDQSGWSYLTLIWRLLGDPREYWLADYETLVRPVDIEAPPGYQTIEDFLADLAHYLIGLHQTKIHPAEQSLRGGTQTLGNLFDKRAPVILALQRQLKNQMSDIIAALPADDAHPFLRRVPKSKCADFSGAWSVRLRSQGYHVNHMHSMGWLSSAFYVSLPSEVSTPVSTELPAGALSFGVPDASLGLDLPPRRVEIPKAGRLVLFPSYMWHGTIPFESDVPRLTVAFDALPA